MSNYQNNIIVPSFCTNWHITLWHYQCGKKYVNCRWTCCTTTITMFNVNWMNVKLMTMIFPPLYLIDVQWMYYIHVCTILNSTNYYIVYLPIIWLPLYNWVHNLIITLLQINYSVCTKFLRCDVLVYTLMMMVTIIMLQKCIISLQVYKETI